MKKTVIIIIALSVAIFFTGVVLVLALFSSTEAGSKIKEIFSKEDTTYSYSYSMAPTATNPVVPQDTESWIDINSIAGDLATATESDTSSTSVTLAPIVIGTDGANNITSIVYVDQNGNIVDPNLIKDSTTTTTEIETQIIDAETETAADDKIAFSEYEISSDGIVTDYLGSSTFVMMPSKIQGVTVKGIGPNCFKGKPIRGIQFPATLSSIDAFAFQDCTELENVIFVDPKADVIIGNSAFKGCTSLKNINLPITSSIGMSAFESCKSLKSLDIKKGTKEIGQYCFAFCDSLTTLIIRDENTVFKNEQTFKEHNPDLIVYCEVGSDVEFKMREFGLDTSPISS